MTRLKLPDGIVRWGIRNARVPAVLLHDPPAAVDNESLCAVDLVVSGDRIESILPAHGGPEDAGLPFVDAGGGIVLPCFVDAHTHLDKGHIAPRIQNPDGTRDRAIEAVALDRTAHWSAADVRARMEFGLRSAYAHGTAAIRTHLDSVGPQTRISWPVFAELREAWRDRMDLQASPLFGIELALDDMHMRNVEDMVHNFGRLVGAVTYPGPSLIPGLRRLFRLAMEKGYDLDFHVDETDDPDVNTLAIIAETALDMGFTGRILAGHCCSLSLMDDDESKRTIDYVVAAGIAVVSLPMCNMYLQGRGDGTPRWRGTTAFQELAAAGVPVSIASDNTRDPFYAHGDLDMAEVWREGTRILHLDHPFDGWARTVARTPAAVLGCPEHGSLRQGGLADFILFRARSLSEWMARPQQDRTVVRQGRPIPADVPDYRELDYLQGLRP